MRTRFYIEKRKDQAGALLAVERPVFMSVSFGGNRVIIGTGIKTDMNAWDPDLQRIRPSYADAQNQNEWLETMQAIAAKTLEALAHSDSEMDPDSFRKLFQQLKPKYSSGFFSLYFQFMESNSNSWSKATYRKIRSLYSLLRDFEDHSAYSISFQTLNGEFLDRFTAFCSEKGYQNSTTYKYVNNLVWYLNWATDNGYNVYRDYRQFYKQMEVPIGKSVQPRFLHWIELMKLHEFNTENRRMERVRDLFCFMCFAGVRFSELQNLKKEDMKTEELVIRKKGGGERRVPMNKYAMQIHRKYENKFYLNNTAFPLMSVMTMNKYLKLIGKEIGLNRLVSPGNEGEDWLPLYEGLTVGIAVNTFIRNALELDIPVEIISGFTGVQNDSRVRRIKMDLAKDEMKKFDQK